MKERPILLNGPMVRATLEGRKTMTRRVIKPQPDGDFMQRGRFSNGEPGFIFERNRKNWIAPDKPDMDLIRCPYGQPGDRLWVRETWRPKSAWSGSMSGCSVEYRAGGEKEFDTVRVVPKYQEPWHPSIHMPRWASRLTLEIVSVRVQRLQDISEEDAKAEGVERLSVSEALNIPGTWKGAFADLWKSISGPGSWDANPWVWVIEFKRV